MLSGLPFGYKPLLKKPLTRSSKGLLERVAESVGFSTGSMMEILIINPLVIQHRQYQKEINNLKKLIDTVHSKRHVSAKNYPEYFIWFNINALNRKLGMLSSLS